MCIIEHRILVRVLYEPNGFDSFAVHSSKLSGVVLILKYLGVDEITSAPDLIVVTVTGTSHWSCV